MSTPPISSTRRLSPTRSWPPSRRRGRGAARAHQRRPRRVLEAAGVDPSHERHYLALAAYHRFWEPHTHTDPQVRPLWEGQGARDQGRHPLQHDLVAGLPPGGVRARWCARPDRRRCLFQRDRPCETHPEAFREACRAVGVSPTAAVYVGDRMFEDVHGPQQVGMRAIWIPHSDLPAAQRVQVTAVPDATAHELLDVLRIVDGWTA